jgi:ribosomal-protein-alanine N-acetyltransferase
LTLGKPGPPSSPVAAVSATGASGTPVPWIDDMQESDLVAVASLSPSSRVEEAQLRDELARPWSRLWVAREHGQGVIAFLLSWHVADELHVLDVATREDRRRRGLARALLQTAIAYGRSQRVRHILLEARRSNVGAIALYRSLGFFAISIRPRYYPDDEDAVEMRLLLDPDTGAVVAGADEVALD